MAITKVTDNMRDTTSLDVSKLSGAVPVAKGGTGVTAVGTSGNVLTSNGSAWASTAPAAAGADTSLSNLSATGEQRVAHSWIQFVGTGTVSITDSYNVSSLTDNGTGKYTVTFTTAMPNDDYVVTGGVAHYVSGQNWRRILFGDNANGVTAPATGSYMVGASNHLSLLDASQLMCIVHGD